jgi:transcriptional regulator with XRE-family HTH domain
MKRQEVGEMVSRLKIERVKRGVTQVDLFLKTGIPAWRVSLIERGIPPRDDEAKKLAEALKVGEEELFDRNGGRAL